MPNTTGTARPLGCSGSACSDFGKDSACKAARINADIAAWRTCYPRDNCQPSDQICSPVPPAPRAACFGFTCNTTIDQCTATYTDTYNCECKRPPPKGGEKSQGNGTSGALGPLPSNVTVTIGSGTSTIWGPDSIAGVPLGSQIVTRSLPGSIVLRFTPTVDPQVAKVVMLADTEDHSIVLGGHSIQVTDVRMESSTIKYYASAPSDNVYGTFVIRVSMTIDGHYNVSIPESGTLLASFDAATGIWSDVLIYGEFGDITIVPALNAWGALILVVLLAAAGMFLARRRVIQRWA